MLLSRYSLKNSAFCVIITTTDSQDLAKMLAKNLIQQKLAACVQIDQVTSIFEYNNKIEEVTEFRLAIKAIDSNYELIERAILQNHNYQVPQIIKLKIDDGLKEYLSWMANK
jgi:periplasmic divalent cation tolerance protein